MFEHSEKMDLIVPALVRAQSKIRNVTTDAVNPFYSSAQRTAKYATLAAVLDVIRGPLTENELAFTQLPGNDGQRVTVTSVIMHPSGQWISDTVGATPAQAKEATQDKGAKSDAQAIGSVISYLRRYGCAAMFMIAQVDDDGEGAEGRGNGKSGHWSDELWDRATRAGLSADDWKRIALASGLTSTTADAPADLQKKFALAIAQAIEDRDAAAKAKTAKGAPKGKESAADKKHTQAIRDIWAYARGLNVPSEIFAGKLHELKIDPADAATQAPEKLATMNVWIDDFTRDNNPDAEPRD
jgi:hypothetical protein